MTVLTASRLRPHRMTEESESPARKSRSEPVTNPEQNRPARSWGVSECPTSQRKPVNRPVSSVGSFLWATGLQWLSCRWPGRPNRTWQGEVAFLLEERWNRTQGSSLQYTVVPKLSCVIGAGAHTRATARVGAASKPGIDNG